MDRWIPTLYSILYPPPANLPVESKDEVKSQIVSATYGGTESKMDVTTIINALPLPLYLSKDSALHLQPHVLFSIDPAPGQPKLLTVIVGTTTHTVGTTTHTVAEMSGRWTGELYLAM